MDTGNCKAKMFNFIHFMDEFISLLYITISIENLHIRIQIIKFPVQILYP